MTIPFGPCSRMPKPRPANRIEVSNSELVTVREAMRGLNRLIARLQSGEQDKFVLTQRGRIVAVLTSFDLVRDAMRSADDKPGTPELAAKPYVDALWAEMEKPPTTPEAWSFGDSAWQDGYRQGLAKAREVAAIMAREAA